MIRVFFATIRDHADFLRSRSQLRRSISIHKGAHYPRFKSIDVPARIRLFGKLKLTNRARPEFRAGFLIGSMIAASHRASGTTLRTTHGSGVLLNLTAALCFRPVLSGGRRSGAMHFCLVARNVKRREEGGACIRSLAEGGSARPCRASLLPYLHFGRRTRISPMK